MNNYRQIGPLAVLEKSQLEYAQSLSEAEKRNLIISGYIDFTLRRAIFFRADGTSLVVSMNWFANSNAEHTEDFDDLEILNQGKSVRLGKCLYSSKNIIYDVDNEQSLKNESLN